MKRCLIILLIAISVLGVFFVFSNVAEAVCDTKTVNTSKSQCNNGTSKSDSGGCGTACLDLCGTSFASGSVSECRSKANNTRPWGKYSVTKTTTVYNDDCYYNYYLGRYVCYDCSSFDSVSYSFSLFDKLCSTGDKCGAATCAAGNEFLRPGQCSCGSVGGNYKICCKKESDGSYTPTKARKYPTQDNYSPEEGYCGGGVETIRGTSCPASPVVFAVDINAAPVTIDSGESTSLTWQTTNASNCIISSGIGSVAATGTRSVSPIVTTTYTLSCAQTGSPANIKSDSVTVTVRGTGCTVNSFNASPSSIDSGDSSTLTWSVSSASGCSISGVASGLPAAGNRTVSPTSTTTYTLTCNATSGGTCAGQTTVNVGAPPPDPGSCPPSDVSDPSSVSASASATRTCLPYHPNGPANSSPEINDTTLSWSSSAPNRCSALIGGGSPSSSSVNCVSDSGNNWSPSGSSGSEEKTPVSTDTYSVRCTREAYTCSSSRSFSGSGSQNDNNCEASCTSLEGSYSAISSCSCSSGSCDERYTSGASNCELWTKEPVECEEEGQTGCTQDVPPCVRYACRYYTYNQSVTSKRICPATDTDSVTVKVVVQPRITEFKTDPPKSQILLNQFINLMWTATKSDSGTELKCTPTIERGDGTGWVGALNSLEPFGTKSNLSPQVTTNYLLTCRNMATSDRDHCYRNSNTSNVEVKVFTIDLEEIPAFRDGVMNLVSRIGKGLAKALN